jgi:hypothetical protein
MTRKDEIDTMLTRLVALSAAHLHRAPEAVTWGDVKVLSPYWDWLPGQRRGIPGS